MESHQRSDSRGHGRRGGNELQSDPAIYPDEHHVAMHELSIALNIVEIAEEELARHGGERVRAVHLQIGSLSGVAADALRFSFGLACEGTPVEGSRLILEETEGRNLEVLRMEIEP